MAFHIRSIAARRRERAAWQNVSLAAGFLAGRHFVGTSDLHYGYWCEDLEPVLRNLARAQENYSTFLLDHIPIQDRRILDVGCGAGSIASKLIERGHQVDCVSPSSLLNQQATELLGKRARLFECKYEDFQTTDTYDAILFCESFQYVNLEQGLLRVCSQLRVGGSLIICDFFRLPVAGHSPIGGGHPLSDFRNAISRFPLRLVEDIDITLRTSPTFTVIDDVYNDVLQPIWSEVDRTFAATHPIWSKCMNKVFRKRIAKIEKKYFSHEQTAESFQRFKTYRLMRYEME